MDLVDIHDVIIRLLDDAVHHLLDTLLEIPTELGASEQRAQIKLVYLTAFQTFRYLWMVGVDPCCKTIDDSRLSHTRLSDMQGIVLLLTTKHLDGPEQLFLPANQGIVQHIGLIQTGHHLAPGFLVLFCVQIFVVCAHLIMILLIARHQLAHEVLLILFQQVLQQIGGIRLFQAEDALHDMWHVDILRTRILDDLIGS